MTTRIVINGKEITHPVAKAGLMFGFSLVASLFSAIIIFVLLPLVGIAITLSIGFFVVFIVAIITGIIILVLSMTVFSWIFGSTGFRIEKTHKRNPRL